MLFKKENYQIKSNSLGFYQDLEHLDGIGISAVSANLYENKKRDELVVFYFRKGAICASVYTQSNIKSENIKWNLNNSKDKIYALIVNTRNANALLVKKVTKLLIILLYKFQIYCLLNKKVEKIRKISIKNLLFASTGTIGENFQKKIDKQFQI